MHKTIIDENNVALHQGGFIGTATESIAYGRLFETEAGQSVVETHEHYINHLGILFSGAVEITTEDGVIQVLAAPCFIPIMANKAHSIRALKRSVWACIFSAAEAERVYGSRDAVPWHLEKHRG